MVWIWLGVIVSLLLIEYMSKNFTAICFAISAAISCFLAKFENLLKVKNTQSYTVQLSVFLLVGIFLLLIIRPHFVRWFEKYKKKRREEKKNKEPIQETVKTESNKNLNNTSKQRKNKKK